MEVGETVAAEPAASNRVDHEDADDYVWDEAQVISILLQGTTITADGRGVSIAGNQATVTRGGAGRPAPMNAVGSTP